MKKPTKIIATFIMAVMAISIFGCSLKNKQEALETQGKLCLKVDPKDVSVSIDGQPVGLASEFTMKKGCLALEQGPHKLALEKQGFQTYERDLYIGSGSQYINIRLVKDYEE